MASITGTVRLAGPISPYDTENVYPVTDEQYNLGGYRSVSDTTERDSISSNRRKEGMLVYVTGNSTLYILSGGDWYQFSGGGISDHGSLSGLGDDDHPQYRLLTNSLFESLAITYAGQPGANGITIISTAGDVCTSEYKNTFVSLNQTGIGRNTFISFSGLGPSPTYDGVNPTISYYSGSDIFSINRSIDLDGSISATSITSSGDFLSTGNIYIDPENTRELSRVFFSGTPSSPGSYFGYYSGSDIFYASTDLLVNGNVRINDGQLYLRPENSSQLNDGTVGITWGSGFTSSAPKLTTTTGGWLTLDTLAPVGLQISGGQLSVLENNITVGNILYVNENNYDSTNGGGKIYFHDGDVGHAHFGFLTGYSQFQASDDIVTLKEKVASKVDGDAVIGDLIGEGADWYFNPSAMSEYTYYIQTGTTSDPEVTGKSGCHDHSLIWNDDENCWHLFGIHTVSDGVYGDIYFPHGVSTFIHAKSTNLSGSSWSAATDDGVVKSLSNKYIDGKKVDIIWAPHVIEHDNAYYMFYTGVESPDFDGSQNPVYEPDPGQRKQRIFVAKTYDLNDWTSPELKYCLDGTADFTTYHLEDDYTFFCRDPYVEWDEDYNRWLMFVAVQIYSSYTQTGLEHKGAIGVASAKTLMGDWDLFTWIPSTEDGQNSESAHIINGTDGNWYLMYTADKVGGVFADYCIIRSASTLSDFDSYVHMTHLDNFYISPPPYYVASEAVKSKYDDNLWICSHIGYPNTHWAPIAFDKAITFSGAGLEFSYTGHSACTIPYTSETRSDRMNLSDLLWGHIHEEEIHGGLVRSENIMGADYPNIAEMGSGTRSRFRFNDHLFINSEHSDYPGNSSIYFQITGDTIWSMECSKPDGELKWTCTDSSFGSRYAFYNKPLYVNQNIQTDSNLYLDINGNAGGVVYFSGTDTVTAPKLAYSIADDEFSFNYPLSLGTNSLECSVIEASSWIRTTTNLIANQNAFLNYDGGSSDSYLWFKGNTTGDTNPSLKYANTSNSFVLNRELEVSGDTIVSGDTLYLNESASSPTSIIYFENTHNESLSYNGGTGQFSLTNDLTTTGNYSGSNLYLKGDIYIDYANNVSQPEHSLYFYNLGTTGAYLRFNKTTDTFTLSDKLTLPDALYVEDIFSAYTDTIESPIFSATPTTLWSPIITGTPTTTSLCGQTLVIGNTSSAGSIRLNNVLLSADATSLTINDPTAAAGRDLKVRGSVYVNSNASSTDRRLYFNGTAASIYYSGSIFNFSDNISINNQSASSAQINMQVTGDSKYSIYTSANLNGDHNFTVGYVEPVTPEFSLLNISGSGRMVGIYNATPTYTLDVGTAYGAAGSLNAESIYSGETELTELFSDVSHTHSDYATKYKTKSMTILEPGLSETFPMFYTDTPLTGIQMNTVCPKMQTGGTVTWSLTYSSPFSGTPTLISFGTEYTSGGTEFTSFINSSIPADNWVSLGVSSGGTSSAPQFHITFKYTE